MPGPLDGFRIVDVSRGVPGRECTRILADYGADVISILDPGQFPPPGGGAPRTGPMTPRNKRGMFLDLRVPGSLDVFMRLARQVDGIVESNRPGAAQRLGIDYEIVKKVNPTIVYCALTGFGQTGPYAGIAGHDIGFQAAAGMVPIQDGVPDIPAFRVADFNAATFSAMAVVMALLARSRSGQGQFVDVAFLDVSLTLPLQVGPNEYFRGEYPAYQVYETKDGRYLALSTFEPAFWVRLCTFIGKPEWAPYQRPQKPIRDEMFVYFRHFFKQKALDEWIPELMENDVQFGPVNQTIEEIKRDPQVKAREMVLETTDPVTQRTRYEAGYALKFAGTPGGPKRPPVLFGQDTDDVLTELGYSSAEILTLRKAGIAA